MAAGRPQGGGHLIDSAGSRSAGWLIIDCARLVSLCRAPKPAVVAVLRKVAPVGKGALCLLRVRAGDNASEMRPLVEYKSAFESHAQPSRDPSGIGVLWDKVGRDECCVTWKLPKLEVAPANCARELYQASNRLPAGSHYQSGPALELAPAGRTKRTIRSSLMEVNFGV